MPDPIKDLYNSVKSNGLFVDESDFRSQLAKAPKEVYSTVSDLFVDYNDFENVLGFKKKVGGTVSQTSPSQSVFVSETPEQRKQRHNSTFNADAKEILTNYETGLDNAFNQKDQVGGINMFGVSQFVQSREGKAGKIVSDFQKNGTAKKEDIKYLQNVAPKAATQIVFNGVPDDVKQKIEKTGKIEDKDIETFDATHKGIIEGSIVQQTANYFRDFNAKQISKLESIPGFNRDMVSNPAYIDQFYKQINAQKAKEVAGLNSQYPVKNIASGVASVQVRENGKEYEAKLKEINQRYSNSFDAIGRLAASRTASPDKDPLEVGLEYLKYADPDKYALRQKAGSSGVDRDIADVGSQIQYGTTTDINKLKNVKANADRLDDRFPDKIIADTRRRLGAELYKEDNWFANLKPSIKELDKAAEQLPQANKDAYFKYVRPSEERMVGTYIPQSGAINQFGSGVMSTVEGTNNFLSSLIGQRSASDVAKDALNQPFKTRFEAVGAGPQKARLDELKKKSEEGKVLTPKELEEKNDLEKYTDVRSTAQEIIDGSVNLAGQVVFQALGTKGLTAGLGATVKGLGFLKSPIATGLATEEAIAASATDMGLTIPQIANAAGAMVAYASSYDQAEQEGMMLYPNDPTKRKLYAKSVASLNALTERIFKDEKVLDAFRREVKPNVGALVNDIAAGRLSREALQPKVKSIVMDGLKIAGLSQVEGAKETLEEVATSVGTDLTKMILSPERFDPNQMAENVASTATTMFTDGQLVALFAGVGEFRANKVGINLLSKIGTDANFTSDVKSVINAQVLSGELTSEQGREKMDVVNEIERVNKVDMPKVNAVSELSDNASKKYAIALAHEKLLKKQLLSTEDEALKTKIQDQIKSSEEFRKSILDKKVFIDDNFNVNATNQSTVQEGRTESNISQPQGAVQGQPEIGQGEGIQGQATQPQANVGDSNIGGQGQVAGQELSNIESPLPKKDWAIITATEESVGPADDPRNVEANNKLEQELIDEFGEGNVKRVDGVYENIPQGVSFLVSGITEDRAMEIGLKYNQQSVISNSNNVFSDGSGFNPYKGKIIIGEEAKKQPGYSILPDGTAFSIDIAWDKKLPMSQSKSRISKALAQSIPNATKSLEKSGIKIQVVNPATDTEAAAAARGNQGLFISEDGTIIIDESKLANEIEAGLVVWHEASHPVMNIIRNTNKPLYDAVVRGLKNAAKTNDGVFGALDWAKSQPQYDNVDTQNDEAIVETIGRINAGLIDINSLDTGLRQKLIDFVNSIAKFFGIDPILDDTDIAAFKKTVSEVADALKTGRDIGEIVGQENVGDFQNNRTQTRAVTIAKGTESMRKYGLKEGKNTTRKIGEALEKRTREKLGIIGREDRSESAMKKISSYMADEVRYFIEQFGENSGKGWYGEKFQKGIDAMSKIFPEFETDQNARDLFTMLVAVTSDGTEVMQNFKQASMAYQNFKDTGKMPTEASAQRSASYLVNFKNIQDLLDRYNGDIAAIKKELLKVSSISDLNKERKGQGLEKLKTSWPAKFKVPLAASIFGPKLGMFYANLSGMENYPTLDRWWSRTFNRYRGTLIPQITRGFNKKGEALGIDRYKQIAGLENASEDEIIAKIIQDRDTYEDKGFKNGTDAEKAANTIYKKLFIELNDAPFGAKDREFMYDTFVDAKKKLNTSGINVTIADIQAILWYFEKNLYKKLGVTKPIQGISYEDAALKTFDKWSKAGGSFDYNIEKAEEGDTIEEIDEMSDDVADQASVGNRDIANQQIRSSGNVKNEAAKTQGFFSDVVTGLSDKYKPIREWEPVLKFNRLQEEFKNVFDKYMGNFDLHIATSIPTFRETQVKVGNAIVDMYDGKNALVYDIGGSEGGFVKAITESSEGSIRTINLDPNPDMQKVHEAKPVVGSRFVKEAFYEGFEENGVEYKAHVPKQKADVVHESMVFQFITPERENYVREVASKYLKDGGLFVTEQKFSQPADVYAENEKKKSAYKDKYYTKEQQAMKSDDVLVGMKENQANLEDYKKVLSDNFKYVEQYWDSGNFKGFVASNSKSKVDEFMSKVGSTQSEFTTTPLKNNEQASVGNRLLAPNGKPSNLTPKQYEQVRTPQFKNWFGDWENDPANASKVVDENGEPLVVYHGTQSEFTKFSKSFGRGKKKQGGIYLTNNKNIAKLYGDRIIESFVSLKNPFIKDYEGKNYWDLYGAPDLEVLAQYNRTKKKESNYDGVIFYNIQDSLKPSIKSELGDNYIAFYPNQIKSAIGNSGEFSTTDNRIQASVGNRSEEDLRAPGAGKERNRALSTKFGDLDPETQAKIDDEAVTYFQRPNKQTAKAVEEFIDGQNIVDMADYVLSNPDIPEVSKVWMAAEVAKRMNAEIAAATDQDLKDALTDKQAAIYNEFAKKATTLGQAVQAFIAFKQDPNAVEFFLPKVLRQLKKAGVDNVTDVQRAEIVNLLKDVNSAADGLPKDKAIIKLSHYLAGIAPMKPIDVLQALWYAKILSGVTTQATNFFANVFNTAFELPAVGLRIAIKTGNPMAVVAGIKGFGSGVFKGAVSAADIVKSGVRSKEVDKYFAESPLEYFTWSKWLGEKGKTLDKIPPLNFGAWKYVGRLLSATDALFSTANQEAIANMLAYAEASGAPGNNNFKKAQTILGNSKQNIADAKAQATAEGFDPKTLQGRRRVIEIVAQKRGEKITTEADAIGKRITLNYTPEGWTKPLYDAVVGLQKSVPAIKMVIPFARIVANLTENALNYTPAGLAKAVTGAKDPFSGMKNKLTADERADLFAKFAIGMGALAVAATKMGEDDDDWFEITAGGSPDVQKRYELQKGGWRPYTITLKDGSKISYKDWPIAGVLAGLGHIRDAKKYSFDDSTQMGLYAYGFFLNFYDKSLLSGLQDFFGLFNVSAGRGKYAPESKASERLEKYAAQQVKSVALSNLSQQTGRLYSELVTGNPQRDAKTFSEILYKDIPVMNDGIRPIIDVFGEPVKYNTTERLKPIYSTESEKIIKWLNENKLFVGVPQKKNIINADGSERPMTDQEYYEYRKLAGQKSKDWINSMISGIENENRDISDTFFQSSIDAARDLAYIEVLTKYGFK